MKELPFASHEIEEALNHFNTPFFLYSEKEIRKNARKLNEAFSILNGFKNFFAVKALPRRRILEIIKEEGHGVDCSSIPELHLAEQVGFYSDEILFTSNNTPAEAFREAKRLNAIINLDDIVMISFLEESIETLPELLCFRYNPGLINTNFKWQNRIIGDLTQSKFGIPYNQIIEAYKNVKKRGVKRFGLHAMLVSNVLDENCFIEIANNLFDMAIKLKRKLGISLEFIDLGGGIGIPYRPDQKSIDLGKIAEEIKISYEKKFKVNSMYPKIFTECGRFITGTAGCLVTRVRHVMKKYKDFVGVDAPQAALLRTAMYSDAYHHITVLGKENYPKTHTYDVVSSLCENVKFAEDRKLPKIERGDVLIIHDAGAHAAAMANNYNFELRPAEYLLREDGIIEKIVSEEGEEHLRIREVGR